MTPGPRTDLLVRAIDDGLLVVDPARRRAHALNASARLVWESLTDDGLRDDELLVRLAAATGIPHDRLAPDVRRLLDHLAAESLLGPPLAGTRAAPDVGSTGSESASSGRSGGSTALTLAAPGCVLEVTCDEPRLAGWLARTYRALATTEPVDPSSTSSAVHRVAVVHDDGDSPWSVWEGGRCRHRATTVDGVTTWLVWHLNRVVCEAIDGRLRLHAAAAAGEGGAVLLGGVSGAGKSTLVAAAVAAGLRYLTDEASIVDVGCRVVPYPKPLALDDAACALVGVAPLLVPGGVGDAAKHAVPPDLLAGGVADAPVRAVAIVLLDRQRAGAPDTTELAPLDAAVALAELCFDLAAAGEPGIDRLVELCRSVPVVRAGTADLGAAVDLIQRLAG